MSQNTVTTVYWTVDIQSGHPDTLDCLQYTVQCVWMIFIQGLITALLSTSSVAHGRIFTQGTLNKTLLKNLTV